MKKQAMFFLFLSSLVLACAPDPEPELEQLVGQPGNPRFNLQFENGQLDVDCECYICPNGGNENIFWNAGSAPSGEYKYWVEFYEACSSPGSSSEFTVRVVQNENIIRTHSGILSSGQSAEWTHIQD